MMRLPIPPRPHMELPLGFKPRTYRLQIYCAINCATEAYNRKEAVLLYFRFLYIPNPNDKATYSEVVV